jgi:endonuclease/exonuclease/phosphatase family metal-dependent hydrolase
VLGDVVHVAPGACQAVPGDALAGSRGENQFAWPASLFPGFTAVEGIAVDVPHPSGERSQFGNLLLSRAPVQQVWRHLLPWPGDAGHADMPRIAIEAVIDARAIGPLRVTTTHLGCYAPLQRLAQIEALRTLHAQACSHRVQPAQADTSNGPFHWRLRPGAGLICGDFNCEPGSDAYRRLPDPFGDGTPAL